MATESYVTPISINNNIIYLAKSHSIAVSKKVSKKVPKKCCYIISSVILVVVVAILLSIPFIAVAIKNTTTNGNTTESSSAISTIASQSEAMTASPFEATSALYEATSASLFETTPVLYETTMAATDTITTAVGIKNCVCQFRKTCDTIGVNYGDPCIGYDNRMKDCKWVCTDQLEYECGCETGYHFNVTTDYSTYCTHACALTICNEFQLECSPGICLSNMFKCDGRNDCDDGKDEQSCP